MKLKLLFIFFLVIVVRANAQDYFIPLNHELNTRYEELLANKNVKFMTAIKPYRADELRQYIPFDSVENDLARHYYINSDRAKHSWFNRKLFSEHFVDVNDSEENFKLWIDPLFDFRAGHNFRAQPKSITSPKTTFTNTRGFLIQGSIG